MSENAETTQQKMDRRKKRTSTNQYMMYIEMMEKDPIFATGRVPRDYDTHYLARKWKELSDKLNGCSNGPTLTSEEWRKRLNDWKNTTRCKYRRSVSGEKDITMTSLEMRALELFGKVPPQNTPEQISIHFKSEKEEDIEDMEHMPTTETFQKQLQAAVEEAIGDEEGDHIVENEQDDHEEIVPENPHPVSVTHSGSGSLGQNNGHSGGGNAASGPTYRTIVVEDSAYHDDDNSPDEQLEFITHRRTACSSSGVQTVVTAPSGTVTKLINGDIPLKRLRSQISDQIIYEVKKAPHSSRPTTFTVSHPNIQHHHQTQTQSHHHHHHQQQQQHHSIVQEVPATSSTAAALGGQLFASQDVREVARQLKRLADIKTEKLKFEIARYKFNNPGFNYNFNPL
ncbi:protein disconnected [Stomoxys calcitrans]|uniref:Regulatory protein zeste n=1 Tax=Stomoxys calcitrans TaxID=35570 RepID=A0A1I8P9M6_STOCA|nr:protein disconnected [Stomoxys calcitrans]